MSSGSAVCVLFVMFLTSNQFIFISPINSGKQKERERGTERARANTIALHVVIVEKFREKKNWF